MMPNVQNIFSPCRKTIERHIQAFFTDHDYMDGKVEISALTSSKYFDATEISAAVDCAVSINEQQKNVYISGALFDPSAAPFGRSTDADFYASCMVWADIDEPHDKEALKALYAACKPTYGVITATHPHRRIQLWWKLREAVTDRHTLEEALQGIADTLGGDTKVKNITSLMRLAGTVNYPTEKKLAKGRVVEVTQFIELDAQPHYIENIIQAFPVKAPLLAQVTAPVAQVTPKTDDKYHIQGLDVRLKDGREEYMSNLIYAVILDLSEQTGVWPLEDAVLAAAWPQYERKVIATVAGGLDKEGRGIKAMRQKIRSKLRLFNQGRVYGHPAPVKKVAALAALPSHDPVTGEIKLPTFKAIDIANIDLENIPPRAWLFGDIVARKYVTMIAASPGAGKSVFTMQAALCAVAGKPFGPHMPHEKQIHAWVYNNEEGEEELRRRVAAMLLHEGIDKANISGRFFLNSGESHSICIARKNIDGGVVHTPDYEQLKAQILDNKIDLLIVDPFAETHDLNENSNDEIKTVAGMYRRIAIECNCAVLLVHHTRKGSGSGDKSSEQNSNADSARGGGAQIGVVRRMFTLAKMDSAAAASLNVGDEHRYWYVRFDDAKTNITAPTQSTQWFKFHSISLGNQTGLYTKGDSVGVLCYKTKEEIMEQEGDHLKEERFILCQKMASILFNSGAFEMTIPDILKALKAHGYTRYKERKLREFIKQTLLYNAPKTPVICEGHSCFMKYIEGSGAPEPSKITLRIEEIYE